MVGLCDREVDEAVAVHEGVHDDLGSKVLDRGYPFQGLAAFLDVGRRLTLLLIEMCKDEVGSVLLDAAALPLGQSEPLIALELEATCTGISQLIDFRSNQLTLAYSLDLGRICLRLSFRTHLFHFADLVQVNEAKAAVRRRQ